MFIPRNLRALGIGLLSAAGAATVVTGVFARSLLVPVHHASLPSATSPIAVSMVEPVNPVAPQPTPAPVAAVQAPPATMVPAKQTAVSNAAPARALASSAAPTNSPSSNSGAVTAQTTPPPVAPKPAPLPAPTPMVLPAVSNNPLSGLWLFVDPSSAAAKQVASWQADRPADAAQIDKIARNPQAVWLAGKSPSPTDGAATVNRTYTAAGSSVPIFTLYAVPQRDCGGLAAGGFSSTDNYKQWVGAITGAIGGRRAIAIVEPDALDGLDCLSVADQQTREDLIAYAVNALKQHPVTVYIDAGNPGWKPASVMAPRLQAAGIGQADGFALNVSNFFTNAQNIAMGTTLSGLVGGKHFVVDTGRNGLGSDGTWCNPPGRALGNPPTTDTGNGLIDAFLWIENPGNSDGACHASAVGYGWWADYALGLAQRASW